MTEAARPGRGPHLPCPSEPEGPPGPGAAGCQCPVLAFLDISTWLQALWVCRGPRRAGQGSPGLPCVALCTYLGLGSLPPLSWPPSPLDSDPDVRLQFCTGREGMQPDSGTEFPLRDGSQQQPFPPPTACSPSTRTHAGWGMSEALIALNTASIYGSFPAKKKSCWAP